MRIALAGRAYSGKTSLAMALAQDGYALWSYTDYLKQLLTQALSAIEVDVTVADIHAHKAEWRPLLVALGERIHFDSGYWVRRYIEQQMRRFKGLPERVVWDNCRFPEQYEALKDYGFRLVYLDLSDKEQFQRASRVGVSLEQWKAMQHEVTEQRFPNAPDMLTLYATMPTEVLADSIVRYADAFADTHR